MIAVLRRGINLFSCELLPNWMNDQSNQSIESELPSDHFHLADEYRKLGNVEAKVELQERTKELAAITRANELFGGQLNQPIEELTDTYVDEIERWFQ